MVGTDYKGGKKVGKGYAHRYCPLPRLWHRYRARTWTSCKDPCEDKRTWQRFAWKGGDAQEKRRDEGGGGIKGGERRRRRRGGEEEREAEERKRGRDWREETKPRARRRRDPSRGMPDLWLRFPSTDHPCRVFVVQLIAYPALCPSDFTIARLSRSGPKIFMDKKGLTCLRVSTSSLTPVPPAQGTQTPHPSPSTGDTRTKTNQACTPMM